MTSIAMRFLCAVLLLVGLSNARPTDYPTAPASTVWTNNASLKHSVSYPDGCMVRVILLSSSIPAGSFFGPTFACGFYCSAAPCKSFLFATFIVYTNSGSYITMANLSPPQVVWSANRNRPVGENAMLQFTTDGNLVLRDSDATVVWSTNTKGRSVRLMKLTEAGNLLLLDKDNVSVWASFDHPTDVLVPGQALRPGQALTANSSAINSAQGQFFITIAGKALNAYVNSKPPQLYYKSSLASTESSYITYVNGNLQLLNDSSSIQYMRLESDGHLRVYGWKVTTGWSSVSDLLNFYPAGDNCVYPTVCGAYGICSSNQCSCPRATNSNYFRPISDRHPNLGCSMVTPLSCQSIKDHRLLKLDNITYFNIDDFNIHPSSSIAGARVDEESCKQACLRNCSCKLALFQYGGNASDGSCFLRNQVFSLRDVQPDFLHRNSTAYIKVQRRHS